MDWPNVDVEALLAYADALNAIENVTRTNVADTGKYQYKYADLADVLDEVKRVCQMFKLSVAQIPTAIDGMLAVQTVLVHNQGGVLDFPPMMLPLPKDAQALGSALTYLRRYALLTIFGIAPEDDDGRAATQSSRAPDQYGGYRSGAEAAFHALMVPLLPEVRTALQTEFRNAFGMGLSNLPVNRHGDALTWAHEWLKVLETDKESSDEGGGY